MKLYIDASETELKVATFSEKSYGKLAGPHEIPFLLEVDAADFFKRLAPIYDECIAELRHDDAITGEFHPPYPGASDYPSLDELLRVPVRSRMKFVDTYLVFDILRLYFEEEVASNEVKWLIGRCDLVEHQDESILIRGLLQQLDDAHQRAA